MQLPLPAQSPEFFQYFRVLLRQQRQIDFGQGSFLPMQFRKKRVAYTMMRVHFMAITKEICHDRLTFCRHADR
ncbi:hypothetical protein [Rhizobium lentis]|uniref:Uncharacterized protein n=1 Tax=Rhizobium lentis TaxID=1138194 RepID=A0A9Q3QUU4_9HYPH|nr:hypothetical protein [Rhizobium lentis]MBX4953942.1 hypothetical protein [Rhizobium lentis]MBX4972536.1 hypothetical protein [Rhizobium lentis]MBX4983955.1 hypothetical protein [Rhizobium lentis]MBX4999551.1 hypothetical protein [Rhizobium lentis]MBX5003023.1 hypothetical protein [Rhizobium lentis]